MTIYIGLLQGVNVGKHKRIAMADLKQIATDIGGNDPITVANSGNVLFAYTGDAAEETLRMQLERAISSHVGVTVPVIIRSAAGMRDVMDRNPFPDVTDPKHLHVEFLLAEVAEVLAGIEFGNDRLAASGREIYMHLPNGISGLSYNAKALHTRLGAHHTSRNWNTVTKLTDLAASRK